jgi:hypothetical protein
VLPHLPNREGVREQLHREEPYMPRRARVCMQRGRGRAAATSKWQCSWSANIGEVTLHFVLSWDISTPGFPPRDTIENEMLRPLAALQFVRPLTTFFVVQVSSQQSWNSLLEALTRVAQRYPGRVNFIMSPLMTGGIYNGFLPGNLWTAINARVAV